MTALHHAMTVASRVPRSPRSYLLGLAEMVGADLQKAVEAKLAVNEAREYRQLPNGVLVKGASTAQPPTASQ